MRIEHTFRTTSIPSKSSVSAVQGLPRNTGPKSEKVSSLDQLTSWMESKCIPPIFFLFPDSVGSLGARMKEEFSARYVRAAKVYGDSPSEDRIASEYTSYLSGEYAVCLRFLSPETIFLKEFAIAKIQELLATPNPSDADWSAALRNWVTRLDGIEREFAPCDTARFGSLPSRVRYIKNVREKFPSCFLTTEK